MAYESLFRKYRSQDFEALSGQAHVTQTLRNALRTDRVAQAYLFCGPRGTGKTSSARILAKALNCLGPNPQAPLDRPQETPCDQCKPCREIRNGSFLDVTEIDAASHTGIENVREVIIAKADYPPVEGRKKVYVIDEVHKLSNSAFNALLKTLEEPPPHVVFILATTDPQNVPATIVSRCQRFDFRRISQKDIRAHLQAVCTKEGFPHDDEALDFISEACEGGMRDALVLLEQAWAFSEQEGTIRGEHLREVLGGLNSASLFELADRLLAGDVAQALALLDDLVSGGCDLVQMARDVLGHFRGLLIAKVSGEAAVDILKRTPEHVQQLRAQGTQVQSRQLMAAMAELTELGRALKEPAHARLNWEMAAIRVIGRLRGRTDEPAPPTAAPQAAAPHAAPPANWERVIQRLENLERAAQAGTPGSHALTSRIENLERAMQSRASTVPVAPQAAPPSAPYAPPQAAPPPAPYAPPQAAPPPAPYAPPQAAPPPAPYAPPQAPPQAAAPRPPQASSGAGIDLAAFQSAWKALPDLLRREKKMPLRGVLMEAYPLTVEGSTCVAGIHKTRQFHFDRISACKTEVAQHLGQLLRQNVAFDIRLHDGTAPPEAPRSPDPSARARHQEFINEGVNMFEGTIVDQQG